MAHERPDLIGMPYPAFSDWLDEIGVGNRHAAKAFRALQFHRRPLSEVPNLGWRHTECIESNAWRAPVTIQSAHPDEHGTERLVMELHDGSRVESVLIPMRPDRYTLCISSQVGCAMGCTFCATGTLGLSRNLAAGEIVGQVHAAMAHVEGRERRVRNLVFMGMGEPFHNYAAVRDSVSVLLDQHGLAFQQKHITVSTVGRIKEMRLFAEDFGGRVQLALSLHAGTDATRLRIVPTARKYPMAAIRAALLDVPLPGSRHHMIEYVVLPGVNDTPEELDALATWMDGVDGIVNLIPFNPFPQSPFRSPTEEEVRACHEALRARGVQSSVRWPRGRETSGACGQLMLAEG